MTTRQVDILAVMVISASAGMLLTRSITVAIIAAVVGAVIQWRSR